MRLINCSNCFSLRCLDDGSVHSDRVLQNKAGGHNLRGLTKTIFQRQSTATTASPSPPSWMCTKVNATKTYGYADDCGVANDTPAPYSSRSSRRQFPVERKHKVKKRDLVKQLLIVEAGNFLFQFFM